MTNVISTTNPNADTCASASAQSPVPATVHAGHARASGMRIIERQAAIENALTMALYFLRRPGDSACNVWAATARANRALTLLKQASAGVSALDGRA